MAIFVYEYGLLRPNKEADKVREQLILAHRYYNKLIEVERAKYAAIEKVKADNPRVAALQEAIKIVENEIEILNSTTKKARAKHRVGTEGNRAEVKGLRAKVKELKDELRAVKAIEKPALEVGYKKVHELGVEQIRAVRTEFGETGLKLFWGTYNLIERAVQQAAKTTVGGPPSFRRASGTGLLGVQMQGKPFTEAELFGTDTRLQVDEIDARAWLDKAGRVAAGLTHGQCKKMMRTHVRIRVNSTETGKPVFAEFPMLMHRPLPAECQITYAKVIVRSTPTGTRYKLQITVKTPDLPVIPTNNKIVSIDHGWRQQGDGTLRVGVFVGDDKLVQELVLPVSISERIKKAESIRSIRDRLRDEMKVELAPLLKKFKFDEKTQEKLKSFSAWESFAKLGGLFRRWSRNRLKGDDTAFCLLEKWFHRDRHLWQYEHGTRQNAMLHRRDIYRCFAKKLSKDYGTVSIEDTNLAELAKKRKAEDGSRLTTEADHNRVLAAPSELVAALSQAFSKTGIVLKVDPCMTTKDCSYCGSCQEVSTKVMHTCTDCGRAWDQDVNAANNILARGLVLRNSIGALELIKAAKTPRKAKFSKRHKPKTDVGPDDLSQPSI